MNSTNDETEVYGYDDIDFKTIGENLTARILGRPGEHTDETLISRGYAEFLQRKTATRKAIDLAAGPHGTRAVKNPTPASKLERDPPKTKESSKQERLQEAKRRAQAWANKRAQARNDKRNETDRARKVSTAANGTGYKVPDPEFKAFKQQDAPKVIQQSKVYSDYCPVPATEFSTNNHISNIQRSLERAIIHRDRAVERHLIDCETINIFLELRHSATQLYLATEDFHESARNEEGDIPWGLPEKHKHLDFYDHTVAYTQQRIEEDKARTNELHYHRTQIILLSDEIAILQHYYDQYYIHNTFPGNETQLKATIVDQLTRHAAVNNCSPRIPPSFRE